MAPQLTTRFNIERGIIIPRLCFVCALTVLAQLRLVEVEKRPNRTNIYRICKSLSGTTAVPERHHGSPTVAPPQCLSGTQTYQEPTKNLSGTYQEDSAQEEKKPKPKKEPELPISLNHPEAPGRDGIIVRHIRSPRLRGGP